MKSASRTLVKSPPELWELIDQPERMQGLMCALLGRATEVTVDERKPESLLRWEASDDGADGWIEVELAEKGWGTNVKVKAENGAEPTQLEGWLDAVLEELGTPQKRPFAGMDAPAPAPIAPEPAPSDETPEPESPEPGTPEPETDEPETDEPETDEPEAPEREEEPVAPAAVTPTEREPSPKAQQGKFRRFFGF